MDSFLKQIVFQDRENCLPGFTRINVGKMAKSTSQFLHQFIDQFNEKTAILMPLLFKQWFFESIQEVIGKIPKHGKIKSIKACPGKTAMTLYLVTKDEFQLSIDICPALKYNQDFLVIPKKHELEWSLQFPVEEKKILHNKNHAKLCIKLLKVIFNNLPIFLSSSIHDEVSEIS